MHTNHAQARQGGVGRPQQDHGRSDPYNSTPIGDTCHSVAGDLSSRASRYFSDLYTLDAVQAYGSAARPPDQRIAAASAGALTTSVVTLFPRGNDYDRSPKEPDTSQTETSIEQDSVALKESFFRKHYRRLKDIHDNGPPGEAQTFLAGMNSYLRERKTNAEFEICSHRQQSEAKPVGQQQRPALSVRESPQAYRTAATYNLGTRKDSVVSYGSISYTSQDVPVKLRRTVLEANIDKPLPPLPPLDATPMRRLRDKQDRVLNINKPLPRTPLYCSLISEKQAREPVEDSPVDAPWEPLPTQMVHSAPSAKQHFSAQEDIKYLLHGSEHNSKQTWLNAFTDISKFPIPPEGKHKPSKAEKTHDALKAKISHPMPMPMPQTTASLSAELTPRVTERTKGKLKAPSSPTWLNKLAHPTLPAIPTMPAMPTFYKPKKRPASDESFACQGLCEGNVYSEMIMGRGALSANETSTKRIDETLVPEPPFSGRRGDGSYSDFSHAPATQRGNGR